MHGHDSSVTNRRPTNLPFSFETCDQSDEETWPDQQKVSVKNKDKDNAKDKYTKRTP